MNLFWSKFKVNFLWRWLKRVEEMQMKLDFLLQKYDDFGLFQRNGLWTGNLFFYSSTSFSLSFTSFKRYWYFYFFRSILFCVPPFAYKSVLLSSLCLYHYFSTLNVYLSIFWVSSYVSIICVYLIRLSIYLCLSPSNISLPIFLSLFLSFSFMSQWRIQFVVGDFVSLAFESRNIAAAYSSPSSSPSSSSWQQKLFNKRCKLRCQSNELISTDRNLQSNSKSKHRQREAEGSWAANVWRINIVFRSININNVKDPAVCWSIIIGTYNHAT